MGETRRFTRIPFQREVLISAKGQWYRGMSENLSLYGIYVKASPKFEPDTIVELTIPLSQDVAPDNEEYIDVCGVIVRQDDAGIGCEFQQVDVDAFLHLKNIISAQCENKNRVMDEFYSYLSRKELQLS